MYSNAAGQAAAGRHLFSPIRPRHTSVAFFLLHTRASPCITLVFHCTLSALPLLSHLSSPAPSPCSHKHQFMCECKGRGAAGACCRGPRAPGCMQPAQCCSLHQLAIMLQEGLQVLCVAAVVLSHYPPATSPPPLSAICIRRWWECPFVHRCHRVLPNPSLTILLGLPACNLSAPSTHRPWPPAAAFTDIDEFLVITDSTPDLPTLLQDYEGYGGVAANWRSFGSSECPPAAYSLASVLPASLLACGRQVAALPSSRCRRLQAAAALYTVKLH